MGVAAAPKQPEMRFHLAQAWMKAGDKAKARSELELLLSGEGNFPEKGEAQKLLKQQKTFAEKLLAASTPGK